MFKIGLVCMPFASIHLPSIALTQLNTVLASRLAGQVALEIFYLNHDFAQFLGLKNYNLIAHSVKSTVSGLGDWLFRQVAFPEVEDNREAYTSRFLWQFENKKEIEAFLTEKREELESFLQHLIDKYKLDDYSLVGFTSMFTQNMASFAMARILKERNPGMTIVMGGANCETCMGEAIVKNVDSVDFVFSGPALKTFPRFVESLTEDNENQCHEIPGVLSRDKLAYHKNKNLNEVGEQLDINEDLPLYYDDFLSSLEGKCPSEINKASLLFQTSRGCWWGERSQCRFCGLNGTSLKYHFMDPQKALKQFDRLFIYAPRVLHFKCVDNIVPKVYLTEVFPKLQPPENTNIFYEVKTNLNEQQIEVLAKANVKAIQPGIESLSTATLKLMSKGTTAFQNIKFLKNCLVHGIRADWNLLLGFPGEDEEVYVHYDQVLPLLVHLQPPTGVYPIRFDRFSPYFNSAEEYGLKLRPYDFYSMVYPFRGEDIKDLAYFFMDHNYYAPHMKLSAKWIKKLESHVDAWQRRWDQRNGELNPSLVFEWHGETRMISDSRTGEVMEHQIDEPGLRILDLLASPMTLQKLGEKLSDIPEDDFVMQISELQRRKLLFQEKNFYMSLVVDTGQECGYL